MTEPLHLLEFRLAYSECDPAGIVYYGAYHPWMERVHTDWAYHQGIRADHMLRDRGVGSIARHSEISYERPAVVFDPIRCSMYLDALGKTSYRMRVDFTHAQDGGVRAVGRFTLVCVDADQRATTVPDWIRDKLPIGTVADN